MTLFLMSQRLGDLSVGNCNFNHWAHAKSVCPQLPWETRVGSTNIIQLLMAPAISPICFQDQEPSTSFCGQKYQTRQGNEAQIVYHWVL